MGSVDSEELLLRTLKFNIETQNRVLNPVECLLSKTLNTSHQFISSIINIRWRMSVQLSLNQEKTSRPIQRNRNFAQISLIKRATKRNGTPKISSLQYSLKENFSSFLPNLRIANQTNENRSQFSNMAAGFKIYYRNL